jgi:hypothetical protein
MLAGRVRNWRFSMSANRPDRPTTRIEHDDEGGTVVHLGPETRVVRLGPSMVLVAENDGEGADPNVAEMQVLTGGTTIVCSCSKSGGCVVDIKSEGPGSVRISCESSNCTGSCSKVTIEKGLWDAAEVKTAIAGAIEAAGTPADPSPAGGAKAFGVRPRREAP